jgi:hypothetical protein
LKSTSPAGAVQPALEPGEAAAQGRHVQLAAHPAQEDVGGADDETLGTPSGQAIDSVQHNGIF